VYLVPYFSYGVALAADVWARPRAPRSASGNPLVWLSALLLLWSGGISICVRTAIAALEWEQRDPAAALRLVDGLDAGAGTRVLLDSWSLYYAARARGWSYWGPYDQRTNEEIAGSLDYDYVIHDEAAGIHPLDGLLQRMGYRRNVVPVVAREQWARPLVPMATARYGPYVVYVRPNMPIAGSNDGR
ncbi:MAG: hypothetical protein ACKON8_03500, partial [Planctomycetota bacterium]